MRRLTLIVPYYENATMFQHQQTTWREYPAEVKANLDVIVVDDCSPKHPARHYVTHTGVASFRLFRAQEDVRWNWLFCRNLGAHLAQTQWLLLTDMDHVVPTATLQAVMTEPLETTLAYRFARVDAPEMTRTKSHPNSWLMTKHLYDKVGGYDERLSGCYGTDADFRERVFREARAIQVRTDVLIRHQNSQEIPDAETTTYQRGNEAIDRQLEARKAARAHEGPWVPKRLSIEWVHELTLEAVPA